MFSKFLFSDLLEGQTARILALKQNSPIINESLRTILTVNTDNKLRNIPSSFDRQNCRLVETVSKYL